MGRGTPVSSIDAMPWAPRQWRYFHRRRLVLHVQGGSYAQGSRNHSGSHRGGGGGKPAFTFGRATGTPRVECPGDGGSAIAGPGLGQQGNSRADGNLGERGQECDSTIVRQNRRPYAQPTRAGRPGTVPQFSITAFELSRATGGLPEVSERWTAPVHGNPPGPRPAMRSAPALPVRERHTTTLPVPREPVGPVCAHEPFGTCCTIPFTLPSERPMFSPIFRFVRPPRIPRSTFSSLSVRRFRDVRLGVIEQSMGKKLNDLLVKPHRTAGHQPDGLHEAVQRLGL